VVARVNREQTSNCHGLRSTRLLLTVNDREMTDNRRRSTAKNYVDRSQIEHRKKMVTASDPPHLACTSLHSETDTTPPMHSNPPK